MRVREKPIDERIALYNWAMKLKREHGWGNRRIAKELEISRHTVLEWLRGINPVEYYKPLDKSELEQLYWGEGFNFERVSEKLGVSRATVWRRMREHGIPRRTWRTRGNLSPTPALAYILGVLYGDGWVGKSRIQLNVTKKKFAEFFAEELKHIGLHPHPMREYDLFTEICGRKPKRPSHFYQVNTKSKRFAQWFKSLTFDDVEQMFSSPELMNPFLRGYYESDGSFGNKSRQIELRGTNLALLEMCQRFLQRLGYKGTRIILKRVLSSGKRFYRLYFGRKKQISRFFEEVKPIIKNPLG